VATAAGGVAEIVETGKTGWLVPMADPPALADAITQALADPGMRARMGAGARELAERVMRIENRMAETLAAYEKAFAHARLRRFPRYKGHPS